MDQIKPSPQTTNKPDALTILLTTIINLGMLSAPLFLRDAISFAWRDAAILVFLVLITAWVLFESSTILAARSPLYTSTRLPHVIGGIILFVFWLSLSERLQNTSSSLSFYALFGIPLIIFGIRIRIMAIRKLGSFFNIHGSLLPDHPLITDGIYSRVRHPYEAGTLTIALGTTLLLNAWIALFFALILLLPTILYRIQREDKILKQRHPLVFNAYVKRVKALFPFP